MFRAVHEVFQTRRTSRGDRFARLIALLVCISFSGTPKAAAAVKVIELQPSSPHPRIVVQFEGKPFANAKIEIFRESDSSGEASFTVVTDQRGLAQIPTLPTGKYRFLASAEPRLQGDLYLLVSPSVSAASSRFTIDLQCCVPPTYEEIVASAEGQATQDTLRSFQGLLTDQVGAVIPSVAIDVVIRGTKGKAHAARLHSDHNGSFSAHLENGQYIAFFRAAGFSVSAVPFTISQQTGSGELHVTLRIGPSS
jgi:hypothetical protein